MKQIIPFAGYVLLQKFQMNDETNSGLLISSKEKPNIGKVITIGKETWVKDKKITCEAKKEDIVVYKKYGEQELIIKGKTYYLVEFTDLIAKLEI